MLGMKVSNNSWHPPCPSAQQATGTPNPTLDPKMESDGVCVHFELGLGCRAMPLVCRHSTLPGYPVRVLGDDALIRCCVASVLEIAYDPSQASMTFHTPAQPSTPLPAPPHLNAP